MPSWAETGNRVSVSVQRNSDGLPTAPGRVYHTVYPMIRDQVSIEAVRQLYGPITKGQISRFEVPAIGALNFVLEDVLEGGRSRTIAFEESGKALSSLMLTMEIEVPDTYTERSKRGQ